MRKPETTYPYPSFTSERCVTCADDEPLPLPDPPPARTKGICRPYERLHDITVRSISVLTGSSDAVARSEARILTAELAKLDAKVRL